MFSMNQLAPISLFCNYTYIVMVTVRLGHSYLHSLQNVPLSFGMNSIFLAPHNRRLYEQRKIITWAYCY